MIVALSIICFVLLVFLFVQRNKVEALEKEVQSAKRDKQQMEEHYNNMKKNYNTLYQELTNAIEGNKKLSDTKKQIWTLQETNYDIYKELSNIKLLNSKRAESLQKMFEGHKKAFPYLAAIMADYATYDIKILADQLNWGHDKKRAKKVESLNKIRASANERIAEAKVATYQLNYLLSLYPTLEDVLDTEEYNELDYSDKGYLNGSDEDEEDPVKLYLSDDEWRSLSVNERNQRALDNYVKSHTKSKWQIGRDYELYIGYMYECKGYEVEYYGAYKGLEDLGRDLICTGMGKKTLIIQCKYWSKEKTIHEKHIFQLYATTVSYCIEHNLNIKDVSPLFITDTILSETAKRVAEQLNVTYVEKKDIGQFPRIKCNNGIDGKIYHLPMDQQYDKVKLIHKGDKKVFTVKQAVDEGYRRAYKWKPFT